MCNLITPDDHHHAIDCDEELLEVLRHSLIEELDSLNQVNARIEMCELEEGEVILKKIALKKKELVGLLIKSVNELDEEQGKFC